MQFPAAAVVPAEPAYSRPVPDVVADLGTDVSRGLDQDEAADRLTRVGANELDQAPGPSSWDRLVRQFRSPLIYVLGAAIAISLVAWLIEGGEGAPLDALVISVIVVLNAALGFVQERKAEDAVAELQRITAPSAAVVRGGHVRNIPVRELVPGDVVALREGDIVPADGRVVDAHGLAVGEAALTGESQPAIKTTEPIAAPVPLGDRTNMAHAATSVVSGSGRMVVTATGMATEIGEIAHLLETTAQPKTPLEREMDVVGRALGIAVVVISFVVVAVTWWVQGVDDVSEAVELLLIGVSLAVAAVPEGLPAVLSLVLAVGTQRMAAQGAVLKRLAFAETLGSTSVICTDKTGTLTRNEMSVARLSTSSDHYVRAGTGYSPTGAMLLADGDRAEGAAAGMAVAALTAAALASDADVQLDGAVWTASGDPTEAALVAAAWGSGIDVDELRATAERLDELPFDSVRKRMSVLVRLSGDPGEVLLIVKGAPEAVVPRCTAEGSLEDQEPLTDERRQEWDERVEAFGDEALRTLAIAVRRWDPERLSGGPNEPQSAISARDEDGLTLLAIAGIIDPPRREASAAVEIAQRAGIRVIMITGDHPRTARRIATDVGIAGAEGEVLTGQALEEAIDSAPTIAATAVFARVAPRHKLELVEALQSEGHVVAMTGDGVNDAPALKAADIGIAMGTTGSDVSRGAADMILTDDNFATIVAAVEAGRTIFANISAFLRYLLSSNAGEVLTMFLGVVFASVIGLDGATDATVAPLVATQILWINLLTDTGPALAMGAEPVRSRGHAPCPSGPRRSTDQR